MKWWLLSTVDATLCVGALATPVYVGKWFVAALLVYTLLFLLAWRRERRRR